METLNSLPKQGKKSLVTGRQAVASSAHPTVTQTILDVMKAGGSAVDAAVAGSLLQAAIEPHQSHLGGSVTILYWEAATGRAYQLTSTGTLVSGLPRFDPLAGVAGDGSKIADPSKPKNTRCACIPGLVPGLGAFHERFGSRSWGELCQPAIRAAREGYRMYSFQYARLAAAFAERTFFPSSRALFAPDGFLPEVGDLVKNEALAQTLEALAAEGPAYFTEGGWAQRFVERANDLGWPIELKHMSEVPPRWQEPLEYTHGDHRVIQYSPPEQSGIYTRYVLGVLRELGVRDIGHYTESAKSLYLLGHVLRWVGNELGLLQDPEMFDVPVDEWASSDYHRMVARIIQGSRPRVDLTRHVELEYGRTGMMATGLRAEDPGGAEPCSCEVSVVDTAGNWVQLLHTSQSGGIPGVVVDGVAMTGSNATASLRDLRAGINGWLAGGGRIRSVAASTIVLRDGKPWLALGSPGWCKVSQAQVLHNILDFGLDPYEASILPRMFPLADDYTLEMEARIPASVVAGLARMGIQIKPMNTFEWEMGSFQISWRDPETGLLSASSDPRRVGVAGGF